mmetsp:Transcript_12125/g.18779  ORF Transcript_12125/g.18779 Transcript_12125/m.18779 type:complete len:198 (-) Transcript_12125:12-605(-)
MVVSSTVVLGAGCYWGTEKYIKMDFQKKFPGSVKSTKVGFMNPDPDGMANPSYREVCSGSTGHVEVLQLELQDPDKHYEEVLKFFFQFHDPTTMNRQGNDVGTQYASYIFTNGDDQLKIAKRVKEELQTLMNQKKVNYGGVGGILGKMGMGKAKVTTQISPTTTFYEATNDHQEYLMKNPRGYCNHRIRFHEWPELN